MPKSFPDWIQPMAATLTQDRFTGPEWSFERKFDGIRLLAYKKGKQVELFSRNRLPQNIPAISQAIAKLPHRELILDGEIDWHALDTRASSRAAYHIFDIMWIDGRETMSLPLEERRALLKRLPLTAPLKRVTELNVSVPGVDATGSGDPSTIWCEPWELARREGWEGVIAKRRGSVYEQRRSRNWLKIKCELAQEFVVGGFTDPQGKRVGLGALLVGYYEYPVSEPRAVATGSSDNIAYGSEPPALAGGFSSPSGRGRVSVRSLRGKHQRGSSPTVREGSAEADFVFAGKIGTGFNTEMLMNLRAQLDKIEIAKTPFTKAIGLPRLRAHWVRPNIVVQVGFIQWTKYGKLRHPRLLNMRTDKNPRDVVRE
jgi:ATP-dependent DNA ligase